MLSIRKVASTSPSQNVGHSYFLRRQIFFFNFDQIYNVLYYITSIVKYIFNSVFIVKLLRDTNVANIFCKSSQTRESLIDTSTITQ
jgi:Na+/alanine symporter